MIARAAARATAFATMGTVRASRGLLATLARSSLAARWAMRQRVLGMAHARVVCVTVTQGTAAQGASEPKRALAIARPTAFAVSAGATVTRALRAMRVVCHHPVPATARVTVAANMGHASAFQDGEARHARMPLSVIGIATDGVFARPGNASVIRVLRARAAKRSFRALPIVRGMAFAISASAAATLLLRARPARPSVHARATARAEARATTAAAFATRVLRAQTVHVLSRARRHVSLGAHVRGVAFASTGAAYAPRAGGAMLATQELSLIHI